MTEGRKGEEIILIMARAAISQTLPMCVCVEVGWVCMCMFM